jgi:hypothetical protein
MTSKNSINDIHNKTLINIKILISNFIIKLLPKNSTIKQAKLVDKVPVPSFYIKQKTTTMKQIQSTHKKNVRERSIVLLGFLLKSYIEVLNC